MAAQIKNKDLAWEKIKKHTYQCTGKRCRNWWYKNNNREWMVSSPPFRHIVNDALEIKEK